MKNTNQALRIFLEIEDEKISNGEMWPPVYTSEILERYCGLFSTMKAELNEAELAGKISRIGQGGDERWHS